MMPNKRASSDAQLCGSERGCFTNKARGPQLSLRTVFAEGGLEQNDAYCAISASDEPTCSDSGVRIEMLHAVGG